MPEAYTRQSFFSNGDVIDAVLFNAEFNQLVSVFEESLGHNHDGTSGAGAPIPFIQKTSEGQTTGVYVDTSVPASPKLTFRILGVDVSSVGGDYFAVSSAIEHTPSGGSAQSLSPYLDTLQSSVNDAVSDAGTALTTAQTALDGVTSLGAPIYVAPAGSYVISDTVDNADIILEGAGTVTLPTVLVKGRRFKVRVSSPSAGTGIIVNTNFSIIGDLLTIGAGDGLELLPGESVTLEAISTTELEII